jgi:class 3 adenylate cyclase/tetratricopeptide (TPR) repeat protein
MKFCGECGAHLTIAGRRRGTSSPRAYPPKHLAEKIVTARDALEGERKQITVLFADLKGSTELLAHRDPEEARRILDPILEGMMAAVHRYEGTVNQVLGDGIMALFGAPIAHEDHAVRACYAALSIQESAKRYAEEVGGTDGPRIEIRVGLNSGEVVVRSIASDLHMDYTAIGQTTHLAARMEQMTKPGSIFITGETARLAEGLIAVKQLGPMPVKGLEQPVEVYELTGAGASRSRLQAKAAHGLSRFVGRGGELEEIRSAAAAAGAGHGRVIAVMGEPGVGKSRLFWEFLHSPRTRRWRVLESRSVSYGKATSYLPIAELLKDYFEVRGQDPQQAEQKVRTTLLSLDPSLEPALSPLLWLLDLPIGNPAWLRLEPPQRKRQAVEAVTQLLLRESRRLPVMAVFEDLHWIDAETQAVIDNLVESLPMSRCLLLLNYRPEYEHRWEENAYFKEVLIDTLPAETAAELLDALLGRDPSVELLKGLLLRRTGGNPFFLEESIFSLAETGYLAGRSGGYHLAKPVETMRIPATATAVLASRVDRLDLADKHLLQAAAVVGKDVPFGVLASVAGGSMDEVRRGLARLETAGFLQQSSLFPDLEYTFRHALTHEVVYGSLLHDRRRTLHAGVVGAIERVREGRLGEHVEQLALHAFRGELWDKAVPYLHEAALRAMTRSGYREAVGYLEQALTVLPRLSEARQGLEWAVDLRLDLRNAHFPLGEIERVGWYLREAEPLCVALEDPRRLALVFGYLTHYLWLTGQSVAARAAAERLGVMAAQVDELPLLVAADYYQSAAWFARGDLKTETFARRVIERLPGDLMRERFGLGVFPAAFSRAFAAFSYAERGDFREGLSIGGEAMRFAETMDHPYSLAFIAFILGYAHCLKGDFDRSIGYFERGRDVSHEWGLTIMDGINTASLGYAQAMLGRTKEGLALMMPVIDLLRKVVLAPLSCGLMSEALLVDGQLEEAQSWAELGLRLSRERDERIHEAHALRLLAEIGALGNHDPLLVGARYAESLALAKSMGLRPLVAHCHAGLARHSQEMGRRREGQVHAATAKRMYRSMDMPYWMGNAGAAMAMLT